MTPRAKPRTEQMHSLDFPSILSKGKNLLDLSPLKKVPFGSSAPSSAYVSPRVLEISPIAEQNQNRINSVETNKLQQHQNIYITEKIDVQKFLSQDDDVNMDDVSDEL